MGVALGSSRAQVDRSRPIRIASASACGSPEVRCESWPAAALAPAIGSSRVRVNELVTEREHARAETPRQRRSSRARGAASRQGRQPAKEQRVRSSSSNVAARRSAPRARPLPIDSVRWEWVDGSSGTAGRCGLGSQPGRPDICRPRPRRSAEPVGIESGDTPNFNRTPSLIVGDPPAAIPHPTRFPTTH